jgi:hypothetical protein
MDQREYFDDIVTPILSGECDEFLKSIIDTAQLRQTQLKPKIYEFNVGQRVKFVNVNPKYLVGAQGTIKRINRTKVVVDLDHQTGRFFRNISTPLSMIEKVN